MPNLFSRIFFQGTFICWRDICYHSVLKDIKNFTKLKRRRSLELEKKRKKQENEILFSDKVCQKLDRVITGFSLGISFFKEFFNS